MKKSLKNKIKIIVFIFVVLIIGSFFTSFNLGKQELNTYELEVGSNDTIWSIASDICQKDSNLNIQNVVIEIKNINKLNSSNIYVGQTLNIPIY